MAFTGRSLLSSARNRTRLFAISCVASVIGLGAWASSANAMDGRVLAGGAPVSHSTVTLWLGRSDSPKRLAQVQTGDDGRFTLNAEQSGGAEGSLYLIAKGGEPKAHGGEDNPAIALIAVLGNTPPAHVTVDEFTTIASVWTNAQFLYGETLKGHALGLKIAARNVPSFADLESGGWGGPIQGPLNSGQTPTMANFATIADVLAGCATRVRADACSRLFSAATPPRGNAPNDTLSSAEAIARYPWYQPKRLFALMAEFYPVSPINHMLSVPFTPYLIVSPSAWVLPLKFDGGGYRAGGKAMFDSEGNLWVGDNFTVGWQGRDSFWQGNATKFAPDGRPLSPITYGFTGGGMEGGTFGAAVDAHDNAWLASYGGKSIAVFDKNGNPLTPPEGITFGGRLGLMQGIIVTPKGDVWALGLSKNQLLRFPGGDPKKGEIVCEGFKEEPCKSLLAPFHLGIDQQDRIWVTNIGGDTVTRFPASDPNKVDSFKAGYSGTGLAVDSLGNVWIANKLGSSERGHAKLLECLAAFKFNYNGDPDAGARLTHVLIPALAAQTPGYESGGSITVLRPDGTQASFSPVFGKGIFAPWAISVDGNDNIWVSNFASSTAGIVQLCGFRTEHCPPGVKTGDAISPPGGYVGGGLQLQIDIGIGPAGDVWVDNNWLDYKAALGQVAEPLSTLGAGQGVVVFYGMAKPVKTPLIGPVRQP